MLPASPIRSVDVLRTGALRGLRTGWFLVRIIVPLSAMIAVLQWTGVLTWIGMRLAPAMGLFGLPGEAAIVLVSGYFTGVYGGVTAAAVMPLTRVQMTVLGLMVMTAHNLVVESTVQSRSGASGLKIAAVRVATSLVLGAGLWQVLRHGDPGPAIVANPLVQGHEATFGAFAASWAQGAGWLVTKIFLLAAVLMIATEAMRAYGLIDALIRPMKPVMRFLGLSRAVTVLWITGMLLGIVYGAALIIEDAKERHRFKPGELRDLHVSMGLSHSLLEDTILFAAVGASPFWTIVPRPLAAAVVVRAVRRFMPARDVATPAPMGENA